MCASSCVARRALLVDVCCCLMYVIGYLVCGNCLPFDDGCLMFVVCCGLVVVRCVFLVGCHLAVVVWRCSCCLALLRVLGFVVCCSLIVGCWLVVVDRLLQVVIDGSLFRVRRAWFVVCCWLVVVVVYYMAFVDSFYIYILFIFVGWLLLVACPCLWLVGVCCYCASFVA